MGAPLKTYDLSLVFCTIGGHRVGGYADAGSINLEMAEAVTTTSVGADGEVTASRNNNKVVFANITLRENAKSVRRLFELYAVQAAQPSILPLPFLLRDILNGDEIRDRFAVFEQIPPPSKGKTAGDRVFRVMLPNAREGMILAGSVLI